jgi:hypothetical protein
MPSPGEQAEVIPINLPYPRPDEVNPREVAPPGEQAEVIPINLPYPRPDEVNPREVAATSKPDTRTALPQDSYDVFDGFSKTPASIVQNEDTLIRGGVDTLQAYLDQVTEIREGSSREQVEITSQGRPFAQDRETEIPDVGRREQSVSEGEAPSVDSVIQETQNPEGEISTPEGETGSDPGEGLHDGNEIEPDPEKIDEEEEVWTPPEIYVYVGTDGKLIVVDANGKPVESPPVVSKVTDSDGKQIYITIDMETGEKVVFQTYQPSLENLYIYTGTDGKSIVVDASGKPVESPPVISNYIDSEGKQTYITLNTETGEKVELQTYHPSLENLYLYPGADGKLIVVDANGKPVESPPMVSKVTDSDGKQTYITIDMETGEKVVFEVYFPPIENIFIYTNQYGIPIVVDASGKPVDCPPHLSKMVDQFGKEYYQVVDYGTGASKLLQAYEHPLEDLYIYTDQDGIPVVVDASGKPVDCPPHLSKMVDQDGKVHYQVVNVGTGDSKLLQAYEHPFEDLYVFTDKFGQPSVVDASGKAVDCPPHLTKHEDANGKVVYTAINQVTGQTYVIQAYNPINPPIAK